MDKTLRHHVSSSFKLSGLSLRTEACNFLTETLSALNDEERKEWLTKIIDFIQKQPIEEPIIEKKLIETAILDSCKNEIDEDDDIMQVISSFDVPRFTYCSDRKKFYLKENDTPELFSSALNKCLIYKDRYATIHQFTARNSLFSTVTSDSSQFKLKPIEYLLSSGKKLENVVILGLLTSLKEGQYFLEDPTGVVPLDLSQTKYHDGLFTDGSFVLAEGEYNDGLFSVEAIGLPPREAAEISRTYFGACNYFGGPSKLSLRNNDRLKKIESVREDAMMVFLSDVWLDQPAVLEKLDTLFSGYSQDPPYLFVLMGNFLSGHKGPAHFNALKEGFKSLSEVLSQYENICEKSRFVIVPGPTDSPGANILPRPTLPPSLVDLPSVRNMHLATNPCRIQFCTQEIVIIREELVTKLTRNCIHSPTSKDLGWHFARTVICQASLVPLSLNVCPVYWALAPSLQLYPCPDLIVVGDTHSFSTSYNKCQVVNPGSFSNGEFTFNVYYPSLKTVDNCKISNEES